LSNDKKAAVLVFVVVTALLGIPTLLTIRPFVQPHIKAPAYISPAGCPSVKWGSISGHIPHACAAKEYEFTEWKKYGFTGFGRGGGSKFYRIGNDVVQIVCNSSEKCIHRAIVYNVFYQ
jgi:hypothetical protein